MQVSKKIISLILSLIFILSCAPGVIAEDTDEWDAVGILGEDKSFQNMAASTEVRGSVGQIVEKAGRGGWRMTSKNWYYNSIFIDVKSLPISVGQNVLVEVDYYDEGSNGWFCLEYNGRDRQGLYTNKVYTTGTNLWKTAQFTLYAPTMSDDLAASQHNADFAVTALCSNMASVSDITIGSVRVKALDTVKSADVKIEFSEKTRNYYDNGKFEFDLIVTDKSGKDYTAELKYSVVNSYNETVATWNDTIDVKALQSKKQRVTPNFNYYGRHTLFVEGRCEELGLYFETHEEFAYIKKSEYKNERFGACNHFSWNEKRGVDTIYEMMSNAGYGWTRDDFKWHTYEKALGEYKIPEWAREFVDKANDYDIDVLLVVTGGNPLYSKGTQKSDWTVYEHPPYINDDDWYAAYEEYLYHLSKDFGDKVSAYEYWNEYGWGGVDFDIYAPLAKATYNGVKRGNPNARTVGICSAGTGVALIEKSFSMGAEHYMDDVSYHTYPNNKPEIYNVTADAQSVRNLLDTYETGHEKKIWMTEFGWNNFEYTHNQTAENMSKYCAMTYENELLDKLFWYDFMENGGDYTSKNSSFGMVQCWYAKGTPYLAKPVYVASANFNDLMGTPQYQSKLSLNDGNAYAYHYKRTQDGKDVSMLWSTKENDVVNIDFGNNNLEVVDNFGNPIDVAKVDGTYSLVLGAAPIYVTGNFNEFKEGTPLVYISETNITAAEEDVVSVLFYKLTDKVADIEVVLPDSTDNVELVNEPKFVGRVAELKLKVKGSIGEKKYVPLKITLDDGVICYDGTILIEHAQAVTATAKARVYDINETKHWMLDLNIFSNINKGDVNATLDITYPEVLRKNNIKLGKLSPGENNVSIHLNELNDLSSYEVRGVIKLENGFSTMVNFAVECGLGLKTSTPPVIDGVLSKGEWNQNAKMKTNRDEQVQILLAQQKWRGVNDLSADTYVQWDDDNLYFAARVTDDVHFNNQNSNLIWQCDSIQMAFQLNTAGKQEQDNTLRTEIGIALGKDGKFVLCSYAKETGIEGNFENCELAVTRDGNQTIYELRCPWSDIAPKGTEIYENMDLRYAFIVNDNDGNGRWGVMRFADGIANGKDPSKYARIKLVP